MIELQGIHKAFGTNRVLRGVDLTIEPGETLTIIGGSGTGKSVLFKVMLGLLPPDQGSIRIDGREVTGLRERDRLAVTGRFGMVFQGGALFDSLTVGENVAFGIAPDRNGRAGIDEKVRQSLEMVGLPDIAAMMPAELSGGMRKRVAIARAIAKDPDFILYDEPTTGLDPIMSDVINELILRVGRRQGITSVVITHDLVSAYKISSRIAMLYEGRIIETGTVEEIRHTTNEIIQQFIEGRSSGPVSVR